MRIRTTNSIFGFNIGGSLGDEYDEDLTVNYRPEESFINMRAYPE
jgi:hypothetical protein